jgi:hypothetical protein
VSLKHVAKEIDTVRYAERTIDSYLNRMYPGETIEEVSPKYMASDPIRRTPPQWSIPRLKDIFNLNSIRPCTIP